MIGRFLAMPVRFSSHWPLATSICRESLLGHGIDLAQGDAELPGHAGAVFVFRREERRLAVTPTQFSLDRSPRSLHGARPALQLASVHRVAANTECAGLAK